MKTGVVEENYSAPMSGSPTMTQTPSSPVRPSVAYPVYRVISALYFLIWFVVGWLHNAPKGAAQQLRYFTEWSYDLLTFSLLFRAALSCYGYNRQTSTGQYLPSLPRMTTRLKLSWVIYNISSCAALVVTIVYWSLLYDASKLTSDFEWAMDFQRHTLQSVYVLVDLFITSIPIRIYHVYHTMVYTFVYIFFTVVYYVAGNPPIYAKLDWEENPGEAVTLSAIVIFPCVIASWIVLFGAYRLRYCLHGRGSDQPVHSRRQQLKMESQLMFKEQHHSSEGSQYSTLYTPGNSEYGRGGRHLKNIPSLPLRNVGKYSQNEPAPYPPDSRSQKYTSPAVGDRRQFGAFQQAMNESIKHSNQIMHQTNQARSPTRVRFAPDIEYNLGTKGSFHDMFEPPRTLTRIQIPPDEETRVPRHSGGVPSLQQPSYMRLYANSESERGPVSNIYIPG